VLFFGKKAVIKTKLIALNLKTQNEEYGYYFKVREMS